MLLFFFIIICVLIPFSWPRSRLRFPGSGSPPVFPALVLFVVGSRLHHWGLRAMRGNLPRLWLRPSLGRVFDSLDPLVARRCPFALPTFDSLLLSPLGPVPSGVSLSAARSCLVFLPTLASVFVPVRLPCPVGFCLFSFLAVAPCLLALAFFLPRCSSCRSFFPATAVVLPPRPQATFLSLF